MIIEGKTSYDCAPALTDLQIADFCRDGLIVFDAAVPEAVNVRCFAFLDVHPDGDTAPLFREDWFVDAVLLCPAVIGAVRCRRPPRRRSSLCSVHHLVHFCRDYLSEIIRGA